MHTHAKKAGESTDRSVGFNELPVERDVVEAHEIVHVSYQEGQIYDITQRTTGSPVNLEVGGGPGILSSGNRASIMRTSRQTAYNGTAEKTTIRRVDVITCSTVDVWL